MSLLFRHQATKLALTKLREALVSEINGRPGMQNCDVDVAIVQQLTDETLVDGLSGPHTLQRCTVWLKQKWRKRDPVGAPRE